MMKPVDKIHGRKEIHSKGSSLWFPLKGLFAFFLFSLVCISILGVFFLYSPAPFQPVAKRALNPPPSPPPLSHPPPPYIEEEIIKSQNNDCDLFKGHWVPNLKGPLYNTTSCPTIPDSKNCFKQGRKDVDFLNWRWKPDECDLPRFDPSLFLKIVVGKKLVFVGDSVARNHMESLLCLLSQAETPVDVYKDAEDRFRTWNFPSSNFTLMTFWSKFLVKHEEIVINGTNSGAYNLHIDQVDGEWASKLRGIDYVVISDAHWLFRKDYLYKSNNIIGCVYCNEPKVKSLSLNDALRMVFRAALSFIQSCEECGDVLTILRTLSPAHFENGAWNTGGYCNRTRPSSYTKHQLGEFEMDLMRLQIQELDRVKKKGRGSRKRFTALDVTQAMLMRPDGHPGSNWGNNWMNGYNDCIHWCIPGPIDAWNDLLMAVLQREANSVSQLIGFSTTHTPTQIQSKHIYK